MNEAALRQDIRNDWTREELAALFALPFADLIFQAQTVHRRYFAPNAGADFHAFVDQDRRLPGGLRLLLAKRLASRRD